MLCLDRRPAAGGIEHQVESAIVKRGGARGQGRPGIAVHHRHLVRPEALGEPQAHAVRARAGHHDQPGA